MSRDRSSVVRVRAEVADAVRGLKDVANAAKDVGDQSEQSSRKTQTVGQRVVQSARDQRSEWQTVGGALTTYGAAVTGLGAAVLTTGISYNTLRQTSVAALTTMLGSAEAANAQMDKLDDFARNSPFARQVFIEAQRTLIGFGMEAERVVPTLDAIQNAVAATGGSNQDIAELADIIARVGATGKLTAEDLNMFGRRGVDAAALIGAEMGTTGAAIRESITAGTLDADAAVLALVDGMQNRFGGAAANVKETFDGAFDRVKAAFRDLSASFASPLVDPQGGGLLVDWLNDLADAMRAFERLPDPIRNTAIGLGLLTGPLSLAAGGFLLLAPRAVDAWDALGKLGRLGDGAQNVLRGVWRNAVPIAAALGAAAVAAGLWAAEAARGEAMTRTFADTLDHMGGVSRETEASIRGLLAEGRNIGFLNFDSAYTEAEKMGIAFSDLSGYVLGNADAIDRVRGATDEYNAGSAWWQTALQIRQGETANLIYSLDTMRDSLTDAQVAELQKIEADLAAADSAGELAEALIEIDPAAKAAAEAMEALADSIRGGAESFLDWSVGMDESQKSMREWVSGIESQTASMRAWGDNLETLVERGASQELLDQLIALGVEGAPMVEELANATDAELGRASDAADEATAAVDELAERLTGLIAPEPIEIEVDTDPGRNGFESFVDDMENVVSITSLDLDAVQAVQVFNRETGIWESTSSTTLLDLDPNAAVRVFDTETGTWVATTSTTLLDLNPGLADRQFSSTTSDWDNTTTATGLDADPYAANQTVQDWRTNVRNASPTLASLGANDRPARSDVGVFKSWAGRQSATITVTANTTAARNSIAAARNMATGSGLQARQFAYGGFTGDGGKFEPAGIVHRGEYVMPKEQTAVPAYRSILEAMHRGTLNLPGYANGGQVGTPVYHAANRQAAPHVTVQPAQIGDVHARLHPDSVRDVARELGREVLAGARDVSLQSLRLTARSASGGSGRALV